MTKENLVVLKTTEALHWESTVLNVNKVYRCFEPKESGDEHNYMIYAEWFTPAEYDQYFELAYDRVMRDWLSFGFVKEGYKPITFKEFKERMNVHTYGKQTDNLRIAFVGLSKECFYKFYPMVDASKAIQLREMYEMYKSVIDGNTYYLDGSWIQFGTFGVHVGYVRR